MKISQVSLLSIFLVLHVNLIQTQENISHFNLIHHDQVIAYLSEKWLLTNIQPITYSSVFNNYIMRAYSDIYKQDVILKIGESNDECKALQYLQGDGIVKLLDYNHEHYALLLQYIPSQQTLADYLLAENDDAAIDAFVDLFQKIHQLPRIAGLTNFKSLQDELTLLDSGEFTKIPVYLLQKAIQASHELCKRNEPSFLLHCDLHCRNILQYKDSFIAIDPWASIGPLEYEVASFLTSPTDLLLKQNNIKKTLQNRLNKLSYLLHLNKKFLKECSLIRLILLACLCETRKKNYDWINEFIQVAEIINQLDENE